ncbi:MAG: hypothetical protein V1720_14810 [bacterium]
MKDLKNLYLGIPISEEGLPEKFTLLIKYEKLINVDDDYYIKKDIYRLDDETGKLTNRIVFGDGFIDR